MALTDLSAFRTSLQTGLAEAFGGTTSTVLGGRLYSLYRIVIPPGQTAAPAIPSTAVTLTNTDTGALNQLIQNFTPSNVYAVGFRLYSSNSPMTYYVIDRLSHMGGLSGIVTTAQTVNTAALTRHTSGLGVYAAIEVYTAIGTTVTTVTMTYTNSDGVGSRVSPAITFGGSGFGAGSGAVSRFIVMPLQDGDKGVQSVQSVTLAATTGTAGNFGITLFKILGIAVAPQEADQPVNFLSGGVINIPQIERTACISLLATASTNVAIGAYGAIQWGVD
jgi:hypothetical protein